MPLPVSAPGVAPGKPACDVDGRSTPANARVEWNEGTRLRALRRETLAHRRKERNTTGECLLKLS
jgi:hypothetical protein